MGTVHAGAGYKRRGPRDSRVREGSVQLRSGDESGCQGSVDIGQSFFILDVWQPSSRKVIWSASKNVGTSWSTHTGIANLVKRLREDIEDQEKAAPKLDGASKPGSTNPQN